MLLLVVVLDVMFWGVACSVVWGAARWWCYVLLGDSSVEWIYLSTKE